MPEKLLLVGVSHTVKQLPAVQELLANLPLEGMKVLTEFEDNEKKWSQEFYGPICNYLIRYGAEVLHEVGYERLTMEANEEIDQTLAEVHRREWDETWQLHEIARSQNNLQELERLSEILGKVLVRHFDEVFAIYGKYRNPNIVSLILQNRPDVSIFGDGHISEIFPLIQATLTDIEVEYIRFTPKLEN